MRTYTISDEGTIVRAPLRMNPDTPPVVPLIEAETLAGAQAKALLAFRDMCRMTLNKAMEQAGQVVQDIRDALVPVYSRELFATQQCEDRLLATCADLELAPDDSNWPSSFRIEDHGLFEKTSDDYEDGVVVAWHYAGVDMPELRVSIYRE